MKSNQARHILSADRYLPDAAFDIREAQSESRTIRVRVDWDGDNGNLGVFEVWNLDGFWEPCGNLAPTSSANDLILASPRLYTEPFTVHIERGPAHTACPFEAWAYALAWLEEPMTEAPLPATYSVIRGEHYVYTDPEPVVRTLSSAAGDAHSVQLTLDPGRDYELWIKLRHPERDDAWCIHDPVVRSGDRGGSPTPNPN